MNGGVALAQRRVLTVEEFCEELGVTRSTVYRLLRSGDLTARKIAGKTVFLREDVEQWVAALPFFVPAESDAP